MPKFLEYLLGLKKKKNNLANRGNLPTLDDLKKEYIDYILEITLYNLSQTAKILDISRTTLYNKLNKYRIALPSPRKPPKRETPLFQYPPQSSETEEEEKYVN